jgi:hypothetical protein
MVYAFVLIKGPENAAATRTELKDMKENIMAGRK